jgi:hypothetical protein
LIDCEKLTNTRSENELISELANQIGFYPLFQFVTTIVNLVDVGIAAATGGEKSGTVVHFI